VKPRLLFVVTADWYFCSHRLPLAVAALEAGYEVFVVTAVDRHAEVITRAGLALLPVRFARSMRRPWIDLGTLIALTRLYARLKPDIVHHVALKPILLGSLAAWFARTPRVVNAVTGLGFLFASARPRARLVRAIVQPLLRASLRGRNRTVIVQNPDDRRLLIDSGLADAAAISLIRGAGVDTAALAPLPEPAGPPLVLFAARLLEDKGIQEFVRAAQVLHRRGIGARFVVAGEPDPENPASITGAQLERWRRDAAVEWWGWRDDMPSVLAQAHIVCLPSYREGLPRVLIEAAARGRAIVATDVPGCREVVRSGVNGLLVPPRDAAALADAIAALAADPALRGAMGRRGRAMAVAEFDLGIVVSQTLALYDSEARARHGVACTEA
jgi:glycosyltransferase involved in cell wall biosynthesis